VEGAIKQVLTGGKSLGVHGCAVLRNELLFAGFCGLLRGCLFDLGDKDASSVEAEVWGHDLWEQKTIDLIG